MPTDRRVRLDLALVDRGLAPSRARARDAILRSHVFVDGALVDRPAALVASDARLDIADPAGRYVSRSALKLIAALDAFGYTPEGCAALDIGASTGGFTEVLLERGASRVTAVDVGHGQLHPRIAGDKRVTSIEGVNARDLSEAQIGRPEAIVADVSFISLKLALPGALSLATAKAWGVFLVKPQFEVGPAMLGKGGIVRDAGVGERAATDIAAWLTDVMHWHVDGLIPSPIAGGDGNREFLIGARHG